MNFNISQVDTEAEYCNACGMHGARSIRTISIELAEVEESHEVCADCLPDFLNDFMRDMESAAEYINEFRANNK